MNKGRKQKIKNGYEYDVLYGRDIYNYLKRPKVAKSIKRAMNKRERVDWKQGVHTSI